MDIKKYVKKIEETFAIPGKEGRSLTMSIIYNIVDTKEPLTGEMGHKEFEHTTKLLYVTNNKNERGGAWMAKNDYDFLMKYIKPMQEHFIKNITIEDVIKENLFYAILGARSSRDFFAVPHQGGTLDIKRAAIAKNWGVLDCQCAKRVRLKDVDLVITHDWDGRASVKGKHLYKENCFHFWSVYKGVMDRNYPLLSSGFGHID